MESPTENVAVIDLGTNTFHLLIALKSVSGFETVYKKNIAVKLGKGGINNSVITEEAIGRAMDALGIFRQRLDLYGVKRCIAFGTSALRNARNGQELAALIFLRLQIPVQIIDGQREAELIFKGVKLSVKGHTAPSLIVDIGGGSVEFIITENEAILWKHSFEIGGQRLLEKFKPSDPISASDITSIEEYLSASLLPLLEACEKHNPAYLIGSSGSFDTFADMHYASLGLPLPTTSSYQLSLSEYGAIARLILENSIESRRKLPGMIELRVEMIVVAVVLVNYLLKSIKIKEILISPYALKEGAMSEMLT